MKSSAFREKHVYFIWKVYAFHEKHWKATKTADSTQISHFDLVFPRVHREGQLGISYILVVFGGAYVCLVVHVCSHLFLVVHVCACGACMHMFLVVHVVHLSVWWHIWCMYVYVVHVWSHMFLVVDVVHVCTHFWWCTCVHVMYIHVYGAYMHTCFMVYVVHMCACMCT